MKNQFWTTLFISIALLNSTKLLATTSLPELDQALVKKIENIVTKQNGGTQRPESCPLESKAHLDLLTKVLNIKTLFKENCLDGDQTIIDDVLSGAKDIQDEIDQLNSDEESSDENEDASESSDEENSDDSELPSAGEIEIGSISIDGNTVSEMLNGINNIYIKNSCKGLSNDANFVSTTADIILDISKIGLLVPNTKVLTVAGGGVALASTLKILNDVLRKRFNFEHTEDRQTFIKLNCAFYDIRRDIEKSGFLDVQTEEHPKDLETTKNLIKEIKKEHEKLIDAHENLIKEFEKKKKSFFQKESNHLSELVKELGKISLEINTPVEMRSQKLALIELISRKQPKILEELESYMETREDALDFLDIQFKDTLIKFAYDAGPENIVLLQEMEVQEFLFKIVEDLKYHTSRLTKIYEGQQNKIEKKWSESIIEDDLTPEKYLEKIGKELSKKIEIIENNFLSLNNVELRLNRIIDEVSFTSTDDGSENVVSILNEFDTIVDQIYGKYGEKFLDYTTKKSIRENNQFNKNFQKFASNHLKTNEKGYSLFEKTELEELKYMFACQDARPFRRQWKLAESLAQQGYDFVATNADLFHSDINRIWLGRSGSRKFGIHNFLSRYEKIQMHHKSSIYAKKFISGEEFDEKYKKKYLKKNYLGKAMIDVTESKKNAVMLQKLIEAYDCPQQTIMP